MNPGDHLLQLERLTHCHSSQDESIIDFRVCGFRVCESPGNDAIDGSMAMGPDKRSCGPNVTTFLNTAGSGVFYGFCDRRSGLDTSVRFSGIGPRRDWLCRPARHRHARGAPRGWLLFRPVRRDRANQKSASRKHHHQPKQDGLLIVCCVQKETAVCISLKACWLDVWYLEPGPFPLTKALFVC
jgi:hypothetical protein